MDMVNTDELKYLRSRIMVMTRPQCLEVMCVIQEMPGCTQTEIKDIMKLDDSRVSTYCNMLTKYGILRIGYKDKRQTYYYEPNSEVAKAIRTLVEWFGGRDKTFERFDKGAASKKHQERIKEARRVKEEGVLD